MKKQLGKILTFLFIFASSLNLVFAQDDLPTDQSYFQEFQGTKSAEERFKFFFNTPNRYNQNSGFDWLDEVNVYLNNSEKLKDSIAINYYKLVQAQIFHDIGDYDKSLAIEKELYKEKESWSLETKSTLLDLMDKTYSQLELYSEQIDIRKEKKALGITENVAFYDIYSNLGLHRKAMDDYILEEQKNVDDNDYLGKAIFDNNVGNYLRLDRSYPTALTYYNKASGFVKIFLSDVTKVKSEKTLNESETLRGIIEGNIGKCFVLLKQFEEAIPHLENSIATIKEFNKDKFSSDLVENRLAIAECYLQLGDFEKTTDFLSDGPQPQKLENITKKNRLLASYYDKTGDYRNEAVYLKKNIRIRDSISANKTEIRDKQRATLISEDKAYTKLRIQEQKEALAKSKNEMVLQENRIQMVFISLIFTLLGFAGLVYAYLKSIKNQRLIAEQKHIIENSLVEKDSLLKEIHHRVKNNLQMVSSLLSLQTKNTRSKAAIEALEEGKSRVKAMALIHQKLYQNDDLSVIEMQGYIESLINSVQSVYKKGGHNINITIDAEGVELDIDRAIPFGLILNELVSNSFKYAFPKNDDDGKIYIHLRKIAEQEGFFEYTDNGVGLPEDTDDRANSSMGIRLMNRLVNQLQSNLNIDKTSDGVRFWFNFK
ncbi:histidine kinase [Maribacter algarum]|uniref:histidine kinase n=1 Tax=Maribacter algarum (ex Zhang et al. 2020) TaxID=2578118 RepID=A0A5S3PQG9_9FLAO|nr:histidine kinase dimerization/phosphoacceptor domain -containing protein [Maribacter algarum]TMM56986.1 histidine kinase [Maribacter algarum]